MDDSERARIEQTNWLAHRWPMAVRPLPWGGGTRWSPVLEGKELCSTDSREAAEAWIAAAKPMCLARYVASRPRLHPAAVIIFDGDIRLGRIRPEHWCGYDAFQVEWLDRHVVLSAKARAMFPAGKNVRLMIVEQRQVRSLGLRPPRAASEIPGPAQSSSRPGKAAAG